MDQLTEFLPAIGQGTLAIEARADDAGVVTALGGEVEYFKIGDRVGVRIGRMLSEIPPPLGGGEEVIVAGRLRIVTRP